MIRRSLPRFIRVLSIGAIAVFLFTGAITQQQIHPPNNASAPVVIAVVADHYTAGEQQEFNYDVENLFLSGLLTDPYYKTHIDDLQIVTFFEPVTGPAQSNYGFDIGGGTYNCAIGWDPTSTGARLQVLTEGISPRHIVVVGNHPYNFGCTTPNWTYVAVDAVGTDVLQHEFGHVLAHLFDEFPLAVNGTTPYPDIIPAGDLRNCYDLRNTQPPHWQGMPGSGQLPGCDLYLTGVVHAFHECRMGAHGGTPPAFCEVCRRNMEAAFGYIENFERVLQGITPQASHERQTGPRIVRAAFELQPPPPTGTSTMRLLVSFNPGTKDEKTAVTVRRGSFVTGKYVPEYRRAGRYVYEFTDKDNNIMEVGVLPDHYFQTRSYRGGAPQHQSTRAPAVEVLLQLPNMDAKKAADPGQPFTLKIYQLLPVVNAQLITPARFRDIRDSKQAIRVATVGIDEIRKAL